MHACQQEAAQAEAARERRFVRALLLSFHASQNRSLFATKCMVEVVTQMYREGLTLNDAVVRVRCRSRGGCPAPTSTSPLARCKGLVGACPFCHG